MTAGYPACCSRLSGTSRAPIGDHGRVPHEPPPGPSEEGLPPAPDDASALARDVEALRRERAAQARRDRLVRWASGRTGSGVGAPLVAAVLLSVALVALLPVLLRPDLGEDLRPRPLASPETAPGAVGGLLPDVALTTPAGTLRARAVGRPGVLVLVPPSCACDPTVDSAVAQAREYTRNVRLVTDGSAPGALEEAARLQRTATRGLALVAADPDGALARAYAVRGVTALVLGADGVVLDVVRDIDAGQRLERRLSVLRRPS